MFVTVFDRSVPVCSMKSLYIKMFYTEQDMMAPNISRLKGKVIIFLKCTMIN